MPPACQARYQRLADIRHPEPAGHLRGRHALGEQVGGLKAQPFSLGACGGGQSTAFGIPHVSGMTAADDRHALSYITSALQAQIRRRVKGNWTQSRRFVSFRITPLLVAATSLGWTPVCDRRRMSRGVVSGIGGRPYDAFISYSHAADGRLAPALQRCLQQMAKPWYQPRALRVFRDQVSLSASPDLWMTIERALRDTRYFVLLASPESAQSRWVCQEVAFWQTHRERETFLIALTGGEIAWDERVGDFDWGRTTALPRQLRGWFNAEPLWVNLSWAHDETQLSLRHSRFRDVAATLAASVHEMAKDELDSEDVRQHRLSVRLRRSAISGLTLLTAVVLVLGLVALQQRQIAVSERDRAEAQAKVALSRALAAEAETLVSNDPRQATKLALASYTAVPGAQAKRALMTILNHNRHVAAFVRPGVGEVSRTRPVSARMVSEVALSPDGETLAYGDIQDCKIYAWSTRQQRISRTLKCSGRVKALQFSAQSSSLLSYDGNRISLWDLPSGRVRKSIPYVAIDKNPPFFLLSPDGQKLAVHDGGTPTNTEAGLVVWDLDTGIRIATSRGVVRSTVSMAFSPDSRYLLTGAESTSLPQDKNGYVQGRLVRLNLRTSDWSPPLPVTVSGPTGLSIATSKSRLAVLRAGKVEVWDYRSWRRLAVASIPKVEIDGNLVIAADGNTVAVSTKMGDVYVFDSMLKSRKLLFQHGEEVLDLTISADGKLVASTGTDQAIVLTAPHIDHRRMRLATSLSDYSSQSSIAVGAKGRVAVVSNESHVALLNLPSGRSRGKLNGSEQMPQSGVGLSPDGSKVAATVNGILLVWEVSTRKLIASFSGDGSHGPQVDASQQLQFLPDGRSILINQSSDLEMIDYEQGKVLQRISVDKVSKAGGGFAASADGRAVVVVEGRDIDKATFGVWRWDGARLQRAGKFVEPALIRDIGISPDGSTAVMSDYDGRIILRGLYGNSRTVLAAIPKESYTSVAVSSDSSTIVQYKAEHEVALWDRESGVLLGAWKYPEGSWGESNLSVSPDGSALTIGKDGSIVHWSIDPKQWQRVLCGMAVGALTDEEKARYLQGITVQPICLRK